MRTPDNTGMIRARVLVKRAERLIAMTVKFCDKCNIKNKAALDGTVAHMKNSAKTWGVESPHSTLGD